MSTPLEPAIATLTSASPMDRVEAWTVSQVATVLADTAIASPSPARPTAVILDIPLDASASDDEARPSRSRGEPVHTVYKRRSIIRRDSQNRREAVLKGKEGSRRRQRWENDRLLSNPYAQPPLPSDWEVHPTYPRQTVPYFLAPLWDAGYARTAAERKVAEAKKAQPSTPEDAAALKVTQDLRAKLKRARGAKGLLQDLETEVRGFVRQWEEKQRELEEEGVIESDSEDEEIVFVGRNGAMSDERKREREEADLGKDMVVFQSLVDDHGASFGRYLVHSIAVYYGLKTWSVTTGDPAQRSAYVGLKMDPMTRRPSLSRTEMPQPLWLVV